MKKPTVWIMIQIEIKRMENNDSRYGGYDCFEDVTIVQDDTREGLMGRLYGIREKFKKLEPRSMYDSGSMVRFVGPFEVEHNSAWTSEDTKITDTWFDDWSSLEETTVNKMIDDGLSVYQILK